jgi:hypothetical protein
MIPAGNKKAFQFRRELKGLLISSYIPLPALARWPSATAATTSAALEE